MILNGRVSDKDLEVINQRLNDVYGLSFDRPSFRVVWSEGHTEVVRTKFTDSGVELLNYEVREVPKYRQWIKNKYVLEGLTVVPDINSQELLQKLSYEPIFVFENKNGDALVPLWQVCKFVLDTIKENIRNAGQGPKYKDPITNPEEKEREIQELQEYLFGNETEVTDALRYKEGIVVPSNYEN